MFWPASPILSALSLCALVAGSVLKPQLQERATGSETIIQLFGWNWDSIAAECTNFIGSAGYTYIQVSPPSEHIQGTSWWTDYQIVSYILTSKRGNRSQFSNMISTCHAAGVKVLVDTVLNHMAGVNSGTGVAGSSFTHYDYPGIYGDSNFHHCGLTSNDDIADFTNRDQLLNCELVNLADLATGQEYVRAKLASFLSDLVSLGVDGYRIDAAKHVAASDVANIFSRVSAATYITQEVIWGAPDGVQPTEYTGIGSVQEFRYTNTLKDAFTSSGISNLQNLDNRGWISSGLANVFVANHDTERGSSLNYKYSSNMYTLAMVFSLAHPYGTPTILSSYSFSSNDAGAPNSGAGSCSGSTGTNGWLCQHRWSAVAGLVGFRNAVGSSAMTNWVAASSQQIAFGRGSIGFVVINNADSSWSTSFTTSLPPGVYCNVYTGPMSGSSCSGTSYMVSGGVFSATVAARTALALHTNAVLSLFTSTSSVSSTSSTSATSSASSSASGSATVTFSVTATTTWGQNVYVTGSISQLGNWTPASGKALSAATYPVWAGSVSIPVGTTFSYKYVKIQGTTVIWESDPNRSYTVTSSSPVTISNTWR